MAIHTRQFEGFWAIILGGSSGFGFASVEKLASHGMNIALLYREVASVEKVVAAKFEKIADKESLPVKLMKCAFITGPKTI